MPVDFRKEVDRVARLARLDLQPGEKEQMAGQLNDILETARLIQELDTDGVKPTSHTAELPALLREDLVKPSLSREKVFVNSPASEESYFKVPRITTGD